MIATVALSLFLGLVATAALASAVSSIRRGLAAGKSILRELAVIEAGYRPAPPVRTLPMRREVSPQRPYRQQAQHGPMLAAPRCAAA
jgi:hypothetical protein